ncbi:MAG: hypothetical protein IPI67_14525 [Myxococcales bacterium]|nr:hypothetical protein [Myxococcales bacterium]
MSRFWPLVAAACLGGFPLNAAAQETPGEAGDGTEDDASESAPGPGDAPAPKPKAAPTEAPDEDGPEPPLVIPAPDQLAGHFQLSPSAGVAVPFGKLEAKAPQTDAMGSGWAFGLDAAYGLSRTVAVGAFGQHLRLGNSTNCADCKTQSTAFGAFVRYHLVQGVRFDPWMSAGLGYRTTKISGFGADVTYSGIEWLRLAVGGDWYAFDKVGFGPYLELDMGYYSSRSSGDLGAAAAHWNFLTGVRVTLDLPGK